MIKTENLGRTTRIWYEQITTNGKVVHVYMEARPAGPDYIAGIRITTIFLHPDNIGEFRKAFDLAEQIVNGLEID